MHEISPRWFVGFVVGMLVINGALVFSLSSSGSKQLDDIALGSENTLAPAKIEAINTDPAMPAQNQEKQSDELQKIISKWSDVVGGDVSVSVLEIGNKQRSANINPTTQRLSGGTYTVFLAALALDAVDKNQIALADSVDDKSIEDCISDLLTGSTTACTYSLGRLLGGWQAVDAKLAEWGFSGTQINNYDQSGEFTGDKQTTSQDLANLLSQIKQESLISSSSSKIIIDLLVQHLVTSRLPQGLPDGVSVSNVTGSLYGNRNDAAIISIGSTQYVISVLTQNASDNDIALLSTNVYDFFAQQQ